MSNDWATDLYQMHEHYGFHEIVDDMPPEKLNKLLDFRIKFLHEELEEIKTAVNPEDVVDGLIDLCVVAIGTLDLFDVDAHLAWERVREANMNKEVGVKESRPNPLGFPDLIKPEGWKAPEHADNMGMLAKIF